MGVGVSIEHYLQDLGHQIFSIRQINPKMSDRDILTLALSESAVVITMDKDFGNLVYNQRAIHTGILYCEWKMPLVPKNLMS